MAHILLLEPDDEVRRFYQKALQEKGHTVIVASPEDDIGALLQQSPLDLFLIDVRIPNRNSLELIAYAREYRSHIPVVAIAEQITQNLERELYMQGAVEMLKRKSTEDVLNVKIDKILSSNIGGREDIEEKKGYKLLVVDDEYEIQDVLKEFFAAKGFQVVTASSGDEAIQKTKDNALDVVLLDISMPGMDGIETLREIKKLKPNLGVIMVTAVDDEKIIDETTALGAYHYVIKPLDFEYLEMVVLTRLVIAA